jgi:hypothetical protein
MPRINRLFLLALLGSACGELENELDDDIVSTASALTHFDQPQGLLCGLNYSRGYNDNPVKGVCDGVTTRNAYTILNGTITTYYVDIGAVPGFTWVNDGDRGLPSFWGYSHQRLTSSSPSVNLTNTHQLLLPKGTACGFKETCNNAGETCMGKDPAGWIDPCPLGWVKRSASDMNAPSGCGFVWCEYQDPSNLCDALCQLLAQTRGMVCGLTDASKPLGSGGGQCLGASTQFLTSCPAGWKRYGNYDSGRPPLYGLGWCSKP